MTVPHCTMFTFSNVPHPYMCDRARVRWRHAQVVVASERAKLQDEQEAALRRARETEQELLRIEADRQRKELAKEAKLRAREERRVQAEQTRRNEALQRAAEDKRRQEAAEMAHQQAEAEKRAKRDQLERDRLARLQAEIEFGYATDNVLDVSLSDEAAFTTIKQEQQTQQGKTHHQPQLQTLPAKHDGQSKQQQQQHGAHARQQQPPLQKQQPTTGKAKRGAGGAKQHVPTDGNGSKFTARRDTGASVGGSQQVPRTGDPNAFPAPVRLPVAVRTTASVATFLQAVERMPASWSPARTLPEYEWGDFEKVQCAYRDT